MSLSIPNIIMPKIDLQIQRVENFEGLKKDDLCKIIRQGENVADIIHTSKKPTVNTKRLDRDRYLVVGTGEVKYYTHTETKQNDSLRKTFTNLRQLINTNFSVSNSELFLTLTYAENMQDKERLLEDFEDFWKRLKYAYKQYELGYISIAEPQGRGAWHFHILVKDIKGQYLYIDNKNLEKIWSHGWTESKRLKGDNPGAYFVSYFQNLENETHENLSLIADPKKAKMIEKGKRLHFYPKNFKFFRASRNMTKPTIETMKYSDVVAEFGQPIFGQAFELVDDNDQQRNLIVKQQFNKKKVKK